MSEQTFNVTLTESQLKTFEAFISRVQLNAKEVSAFNDLMGAFQRAANASQKNAVTEDEE